MHLAGGLPNHYVIGSMLNYLAFIKQSVIIRVNPWFLNVALTCSGILLLAYSPQIAQINTD